MALLWLLIVCHGPYNFFLSHPVCDNITSCVFVQQRTKRRTNAKMEMNLLKSKFGYSSKVILVYFNMVENSSQFVSVRVYFVTFCTMYRSKSIRFYVFFKKNENPSGDSYAEKSRYQRQLKGFPEPSCSSRFFK